MATTLKAMYRGAAATSNTTLYTVSSTSAVATVTNIVIANNTASAATATINIDTVVAIPSVSIPANAVATFDIKQVIPSNNPAKTITGSASTTGVSFHISGLEIA